MHISHMTGRRGGWLALAFVAATAATGTAQWIKLPLPGTPRTADGKPNLNASAPRAADGKPDPDAGRSDRAVRGVPQVPADSH